MTAVYTIYGDNSNFLNKRNMQVTRNQKVYDTVTGRLALNDGYCPCQPSKTQDTLCPCKYMRKYNTCRCGLYVPITEGDNNV